MVRAVTDDEGSGTRQISERLQGSFRAPFLDDGDTHDHEHEAKQHHGIARLAHEEVQASGGDKHKEHRLTSDLDADGQQAPFLLCGQLVRPLLLQSRTGVGFAEPGKPAEIQDGAGGPHFLVGQLAPVSV